MAGAWSRRAGHAVGRVGRPCRGRCKYVPVSSVAASMRLTPLHGLPTLPSTVSCGRPPRKKERRATTGRALRLLAAEHGSALQEALQDQTKRTRRTPRPFSFPSVRHQPMLLPTVTGKLSKVGRGRLAGPLAPWARGMPRAGWAGRPTPVLPCAQDSAHEQGAIEPPGMGLRRVLPAAPVPPNHQQPRAALAVDVDFDVARRRRTTARQRGPSTSNPIGQLTPVPPMPQ